METQCQATLGTLMQQVGDKREGSHLGLQASVVKSPLPALSWSTYLHPPPSPCLSQSPLPCRAPLRPSLQEEACQPGYLSSHSSHFLEPQFPQE